MLKGMAIDSIIKLTLAITIASAVIGISTIGSLGDALTDTFDSVVDSTDQTVEVEDSRAMADLTLFVRDKGMNRGCELVEEINEGEIQPTYPNEIDNDRGGYEGLRGTRLTLTPDCFGADASGLLQMDPEAGFNPNEAGVDDNYMPGLQGREDFEATEDFMIDGVIERSEGLVGYGEVKDESANYLEVRLQSSFQGQRNQIDNEVFTEYFYLCNEVDFDLMPLELSITGTVENLVTNPVYLACFAYEGLGFAETDTMSPILIYEGGSISERTNFVQDYDDNDRPSEDGEAGFLQQIQFCEGDRGYVQPNRRYIGTEGDGHLDEEPLIPIIVIEEVETENCGGPRGLELYDGKTSGEQLFIEGSQAREKTRSNKFELKNDLSEADPDIEDYSKPDKCSIYYREKNWGLSKASQAEERVTGFAEDILDGLTASVEAEFGDDAVENLMEAFEKYVGHHTDNDTNPNLRDFIYEQLTEETESGVGETVKYFEPQEEISSTENGLPEGADYEHKSYGLEYDEGDLYTVDLGLDAIADEVEDVLNELAGIIDDGFGFIDVSDDNEIPTSIDIPHSNFELTIDIRALILDDFEEDGLNGERFIDRADRFHGDNTGELRLNDYNYGFNEMYGDLKCAADGSDDVKWHLCHESREENTIEVDGEEVVCDPETGEWSES